MRKLIAIPGFVLLAIGLVVIYLGIGIADHFAFGVDSLGFSMVIIGVFLILLSGIFEGILKKRWGPQ